jgi:hypothetical protein
MTRRLPMSSEVIEGALLPEPMLENIEFETKYKVKDHLLIEFKQLVENLEGCKNFAYIEGPDVCFTYPDWWFAQNPQWDPAGTFIRYRKPSHGLDDGKKQVTWKYKPRGATNNIQRKELNWAVSDTPDKVILEQIESSGAKFNFSIIKNCHIYRFEDATLVFYTVYDTTDGSPSRTDSYVEIEVSEELVQNMTESQAWKVIEKYEHVLEKIDIYPRNRMRRSLFEIYSR